MNHATPSLLEDQISKNPALQVLQALGYTYLSPADALELRGGRRGNMILDGVLTPQLKAFNRIVYKGEIHAFSEANIQAAVEALKSEPYDGLIRTNEKIYDMLCLGKAMPQSIRGDIKSFTLNYIDWEHPENNVYHVTEEFIVEKAGSKDTRRPDIVLFVNGIPLVVIECKSPSANSANSDPVEQAISQQLRNQRDDEIPGLFLSVQLLLVLSKNETRYGTVGTPLNFWSVWKEDLNESELQTLVNGGEAAGPSPADTRLVTAQDRALFSLCRPERLLELANRFVLFDGGVKKIARYQQYFCVNSVMDRIRRKDESGRRLGGVIWHTQGSGKSLTMVFLAKAIAMDREINDHKIVIVTDRVDLDEQIHTTFRQTGHAVVKAKTGTHLGELLAGNRTQVVTTVIDKFEAAGSAGVCNDSRDVFVLVDESHRGQYGARHAMMRKALPNACYIGFTGTPLMGEEKNTAIRFGGIIEPSYTIRQAVEDKAVVPLLYEGRNVPQAVDALPLDEWFETYTRELSAEQRTALKRTCSGPSQLQKSRQTIMRIAWDVSTHYRDTWQGTPYKGQLVAMSKAAGLEYKRFLDQFGMVTSDLLISGPDEREGFDSTEREPSDDVVAFWRGMMSAYGSEAEYNRQIIHAFKTAPKPEIIIVVDKLLTGFDAPCNTVMYLHKPLKEHGLLQAIARVNRLFEGKDFGYVIDYYGVLGRLGEALDLYGGLPETLSGFDHEDVQDALSDIAREVARLPQRHAEVWDIFKGVRPKQDVEAYERHLADELKRGQFYQKLAVFARNFQTALSSVRFIETTRSETISRYRDDLKFFCNLRTAVRHRYSETTDFREYERRIRKLIDTHVGSGEVEKLTELVDIFDTEKFEAELAKVESPASKADAIAYRTKKTLREKWEKEDPAFYRKFSHMIEEAIEAFKQHRLSDADYLSAVTGLMDHVRNHTNTNIPTEIDPGSVSAAFYGEMEQQFALYAAESADSDERPSRGRGSWRNTATGPFESIAQTGSPRKSNAVAGESVWEVNEEGEEYSVDNARQELIVKASLEMDRIFREMRVVNWQANTDIQNSMRTAIEDLLFDLMEEYGIKLKFDEIDTIMERCLEIAKVRYPS